jgi:protein-S-isoprenylcysteine O-methyltransferase Ste14
MQLLRLQVTELRQPPWLNAGAASSSKLIDHRSSHPLTDVQTLELKIPPLALVVIAALLMWLGAASFPALTFHFPFQSGAAWAIGFFGALASTLGVMQFRRARTTVDPTKPGAASSLVTTGIYRRTRNPMYLGFLLILAACSIAFANAAALLILPAFVLYMNRFQIKPEERILTSIFGEAFKAYCVKTPRWI